MLLQRLAIPQKEDLLVRISAGSLSESIHDCAKRQSKIPVAQDKYNLIKGKFTTRRGRTRRRRMRIFHMLGNSMLSRFKIQANYRVIR